MCVCVALEYQQFVLVDKHISVQNDYISVIKCSWKDLLTKWNEAEKDTTQIIINGING